MVAYMTTVGGSWVFNRSRALFTSKSKSHMAQNNNGRGFAGMDEDKQREIASKGGKAAHAKGTAHEFDSRSAREAGKHSHDNR